MKISVGLAETNPAALQHLLATDFCVDWRNEEKLGDAPYYQSRIFERRPAGVTCVELTLYIDSAQRHPGARRLTHADRAALAAFAAACEDPALVLKFKQEPGDMFFLDNHLHMHGRSNFTDAEDPVERRHLRRLWLESAAWDGKRSPAMQHTLDTSRHWESADMPVKMWDSVGA